MTPNPINPLLAAMLGAAMLAIAPAASAKIVCWTNNEGVRECGNAVPPEFAQKERVEKSKTGLTVKKHKRAKTEEEIEREEELERQREVQERLARERAQRDRVLLATFTTEEDLLLTRDGQLAAIDSRIRHTQQLVDRLEQELATLREEAAKQERSGQKVSQDTLANIAEVEKQLAENEEFIAQREHEKVELREKFAQDLARYRELKAKKTASQ